MPVVVHLREDIPRATELLGRDCQGEVTLDEHVRKLTVPASGGAGILVQVVRDLDDAGVPIDDIALRRPTLDDVFLSLTGHVAVEKQVAAEPAPGRAAARAGEPT